MDGVFLTNRKIGKKEAGTVTVRIQRNNGLSGAKLIAYFVYIYNLFFAFSIF
jgi:hypothetical protein